MHALRLQNDLGTRATFVALFALALLFLGAIVASPARADVAGGADGATDQVTEAVETTATVTADSTIVEDDAAPGGEGASPASPDQVGEDETSPVADETVAELEDIQPVGDDAIDVVVAPRAVEEMLDGAEALVSGEVVLSVDAVSPVIGPVEDDSVEAASPFVEIADEVRTVVTNVVIMVPPEMVDVVRGLPLFVSPPVAIPGPIEVRTVSVTSTISVARESLLSSQPASDSSQQFSGLFMKELVAEMNQFHLTDLTVGPAAGGSPASPTPEGETAAMAAYVPIAGTMPVGGGAGASSSNGSSHGGSSPFGGLDAFGFFAAMAALLALCLLGWIRDRSRSGRSIFPSHGGRPG